MREKCVRVILGCRRFGVRRPNAFEVNVVACHGQFGEGLAKTFRRAPQFFDMMERFGLSIAAEGRQASVGSAVGMHHEDGAAGSMQADRFADLVDYELAVGFPVGGGQALGAARHANRIGMHDAGAFEQLAEHQFKAMVEAPNNSRIAMIMIPRGIEVQDFSHGRPVI
jgi:hypothetical protein